MNPLHEKFSREVQRAIRCYDDFESQGKSRTVWAPFQEGEAAYRSQQWLAFAGLLREAGFTDLEHLSILDVGCGTGRWVRAFLDMGAAPDRVHGIDVNEKRIDHARSLAPYLNFAIFNGWEIAFPDGFFDLISQFVVFSSIALPELRAHLAAEMLRVLKPGSKIEIYTPGP